MESPIDVYLKTIAGDTRGGAGGDGVIELLIPDVADQDHRCLCFIDSYGTTVLNHHQARVLVDELERRRQILTVTDARQNSIEKILQLADMWRQVATWTGHARGRLQIGREWPDTTNQDGPSPHNPFVGSAGRAPHL